MEEEKEELQYHHTMPIQLRWNDVDRFGHVNNEVYFSVRAGQNSSCLRWLSW